MASTSMGDEKGKASETPSIMDGPASDTLPMDGVEVKRLMRLRKLTIAQLASAAGLGQRTVQKIRRGGHSPEISTFEKLGSALGVQWPTLRVGARRVGSIDEQPLRNEDATWLPSGQLPHGLGPVFGRKSVQAWLDDAWHSPNVCVAYLEAVGGGGKTAVVANWLLDFQSRQNTVRVYEFSFNGQESLGGSGSTSFFTHAFRQFRLGSPQELPMELRAERLASAIFKTPTVVVLDGVEVLQNKPGQPREGFLNDAGLRAFVRIMAGGAKASQSMLIVTTQLRLADIRIFEKKSVLRKELKGLGLAAATKILDCYDVRGRPNEVLAPLHKHSRGHPLTLHLLGSFIRDRFAGDGRRWHEFWKLDRDSAAGIDTGWVMERYESWLVEQPAKQQLLRIVSLFDGPASPRAIEGLIEGPEIPGLTDELRPLSPSERATVTTQLRRARLLLDSDVSVTNWLDMHAIVRDHFRTTLRQAHPTAWKAGNLALFKYFRALLRGHAENKAEAEIVYAAMAHACRAGHEKDALSAYQAQIRTKNADSAVRRFGLFGDDLMALYAFFDPETMDVTTRLPANERAFLLEQTASRLRWVGRLDECCHMMEQVVKLRDEKHAQPDKYGVPLRYLAECRLLRGELAEGLAAAEAALEKVGHNWIDKAAALSICGHANHLLGNVDVAEKFFVEAENLEREHEGRSAVLPSVRGFRRHELLLHQSKFDEVIDRCKHNQKRPIKQGDLMNNLGPVNEGIYWLGIGLAHLRKGKAGRAVQMIKNAVTPLSKALDDFQKSGRREFIYYGFLARAELRLALHQEEGCRADLLYVATETQYDEMWRIDVDRALVEVALLIELGEFMNAEHLLDKTGCRIDQMRYGCRRNRLEELELMLMKKQGAATR